MEDIVVTHLEGRWAITREGIIVSRQSTSPEAIKVAIEVAAERARSGERARVLMNDQGAPPRVLWDSGRDAYSRQ